MNEKKWSWELGRIAGIDVKIHLTFFFLLLWIGLSGLISSGSFLGLVNEMLFVIALFVLVVLHELGHALAARRFGISTEDITLLPIGGVARLERMPEDPKEEMIVAGAGPLVNVVIGTVMFLALLLTGAFNQPLTAELLQTNFWVRLLSVNVSLAIFNLIPAFPMDGGRVLRAILATRMDYVKATRTAANIGRGLAVLMGIVGFFVNPWLILIALFVWSGAGSEAQSVELKAGLQGLAVRDGMVSQFYQVEANQALESVLQLSMATGQGHLPVVSNGRFLGFIRRGELLNAMQRLGRRAPAYAAIGSEPVGIDPHMPLYEVLPKLTVNRVLPVIEDGQLIGLVTSDSVQQRMWLNQKLKGERTAPPNEKRDIV